MKQGGSEGGRLGSDARNEWNLRLNDEVPTDLVVRMGARKSDLDSLTLTGLNLQMGAGRTAVDLTGDYAEGFDARIQGGVGEATVLVPSEVGVRVRAEGGIGKVNAEGFGREGDAYVNDAYGESGVTLDVDVQGRRRLDQPGGGLKPARWPCARPAPPATTGEGGRKGRGNE